MPYSASGTSETVGLFRFHCFLKSDHPFAVSLALLQCKALHGVHVPRATHSRMRHVNQIAACVLAMLCKAVVERPSSGLCDQRIAQASATQNSSTRIQLCQPLPWARRDALTADFPANNREKGFRKGLPKSASVLLAAAESCDLQLPSPASFPILGSWRKDQLRFCCDSMQKVETVDVVSVLLQSTGMPITQVDCPSLLPDIDESSFGLSSAR